ncbi:MAG: SIR2 family protein [Fimbriimonadaceae bacterium]|nr:SIR2 family protein [Fimbriimonadaceae bacterium]
MSKVVFILGAGASRQAGAPLMHDFLDVARDLLSKGEVPDQEDDFKRVFKAIGGLQRVHSKARLDLKNIESMFTVLELGNVIGRVPGINQEDIPSAINSLKRLIVTTLEKTMSFELSSDRVLPPPIYRRLGAVIRDITQRGNPRQSVSIITFNYDVAVDLALLDAQLPIDYCLDTLGARDLSVPLMKLHGSLNWGQNVQTKEVKVLPIPGYVRHMNRQQRQTGNRILLPIGTGLPMFFREVFQEESEWSPLIVPPSWNKADYHKDLSKVWSRAADHLSEAEQIFIIGYSLPETDSFFRHLYALGSEGSDTLRRLWVFNPDESGGTRERFLSLLGPGAEDRFEYHPMKFDEAMNSIAELFPLEKAVTQPVRKGRLQRPGQWSG